jgi:hypothetical protein
MSRFKNASGAYLLQSLFYELTPSDKSQVVYTLKNEDHMGYPSLYRLYMEADDPTEYDFAVANLGGWDHWERLQKSTWFQPYLKAWRHELEVRFRARSLKALRDVANNSSSKDYFQANKFLVGQGWKEGGPKRRAGQPSKEEVKAEAHRLATISNNLDEDFERIQGRSN